MSLQLARHATWALALTAGLAAIPVARAASGGGGQAPRSALAGAARDAVPAAAGDSLSAWSYRLDATGAPGGPAPFSAAAGLTLWPRPRAGLEFSLHAARVRPAGGGMATGGDLALRGLTTFGNGGAWLGGWRAIESAQGAPDGTTHAEAGSWWSWGGFAASVALDQGIREATSITPVVTTFPDTSRRVTTGGLATSRRSPATTTRLQLAWGRAPWSFGISGSAQLATGFDTRGWMRGSVGRRLGSAVWLVAGVGRDAPEAFGSRAGNGGMTLALVAAGGGEGRGHAAPETRRAFRVRTIESGRMRFEALWPGAGSVEMSGDFTGWEARAMAPMGRDVWRLEAPVAPGIHHVLMRVDSGPWMSPPGLPAAADEFQGSVGVVTAP